MSATKKRWLLMVGLIIATSIPVTKLISQNVGASKPNNDNQPTSTVIEDNTIKDEVTKAIESALYHQVEFFDSTTLVPYPTALARNQLLEVAKLYPNNTAIYKQLAQLEIELGNKDLAEKALLKYVNLSQSSQTALTELAKFYQEQAEFEKQADTLNKIMQKVPDNERSEILTELISLADKHEINKYLGVTFYQETLSRYPDNQLILEQYIDKLIENKDYQKALALVSNYQQNLPDSDYYFLNKQAEILLKINKWQEAKQLYIKAFDPFWPDEVKTKFYEDVLSNNEQLRAYGRELRSSFQKMPNNFDLAMRLIHYYNYNSNNDLSQYVFYKLEEARSKSNKLWQPRELTILARLSLQKGQAERASRYIYTLYNQGELKPSSELRGQILYQLFTLLMDAQDQRLPLTTGNLKFYQDIATADPHPGVIGGILSLIFSDSSPEKEFAQAEISAVHYFNQAAAYRIFQAYKKEYSTSPQLAQMYLDVINFYIQQGNKELANETLVEFEKRYQQSNQFAEVALKLADAYIVAEEKEKELAIYQQVLDYLGKNTKPGQLLYVVKHKRHSTLSENDNNEEDINSIEPSSLSEPTESAPNPTFEEFNFGLKTTETNSDENYYRDEQSEFTDYLTEHQTITYATVLNRYIFTLNKENRAKDIIELFNKEIKKYPKEQGLYEQLLQWLGQTNLIEDQLAVYQKALKQFPSTTWYDRMARWLLRQGRNQEFAGYSKELLSKFDEGQIANYLSEFINYNHSDFKDKLYLSLYSYAHNRFPLNHNFVQGLLNYYLAHNQLDRWQELVAKYYFIWPEVRTDYLAYLSKQGKLRKYLSDSRSKLTNNNDNNNELLAYKLFRADAAIWLCNYEDAIDAYRELNCLYPGNSVFAEQLVKLTRSFGQLQPKFLTEAAKVQLTQVTLWPGSVTNRITAGELYAETNDYQKAKTQWLELLKLGKDKQTYLDTATIFWDYYQYDEALRVIEKLRQQENDQTLLAFEMGALLEAKHQTKAATHEYIKGITEDNELSYKSQDRLAVLYRRNNLSLEIDKAFSEYLSQVKSQEMLILGYVQVLKNAGETEKAHKLLKQKIKQTKSIKFLTTAGQFFRQNQDEESKLETIKLRLKYSRSSREDIGYRLQLISAYRQNNNKLKATKLLQELLVKYPFNYGVINEVVNNYWHMGLTTNAVNTLRQATSRSRGKFYYEFSRRLAARELDLNNTKAAQSILEKLFAQNRLNSQVLDDLTTLYIRTENRKALEECLIEGLKAIESQEMDVANLRIEVAYFRKRMIKDFTTIKDYNAAIKQHIENINRNPEDEEKLEDAITYTERYGGGDELANYYQGVFQQAYKNYRWAVVLARIYKAKGEIDNVIKYYKAAIDNQPEKAELYSALAESYQEKEDLPSAITAINKALLLSNYELTYVKQAINLFELAGHSNEVIALKARLTPEPDKTQDKKSNKTIPSSQVAETFAQAEELRYRDNKAALEKYRKAFQQFYDSPYNSERISSYNLQNYAQMVHQEDSLVIILESFWHLRDKLLKEATTENTYNAARARGLIQIIDGGLPKIIGDIAQNTSTGDELLALHKDLSTKIDIALKQPNKNNTVALLENIVQEAKFLDLTEDIIKSLYKNDNVGYLDNLLKFYEFQGNYQKALSFLEEEFVRTKKLSYLPQIARVSALLGEHKKELQALNKYYCENTPNPIPINDPTIEHYLELLYKGNPTGREELLQLTKTPSVYRIQLINFLIAKKEVELAHNAINNADLSNLWKDSRNAELSVKLADYNPLNNQYFENILRLQNIGQMIKAKPKAEEQLIGDSWFEMAYSYGQWIYKTPNASKKLTAPALLPARLERRPQDGLEQQKLGEWYLNEKQLDKSLKYLLNAEQMQINSPQLMASIGSAYFLKGDKNKALDYWLKIFSDNSNNNELWLNTLKHHGLVDKAREELLKRLIENKDLLEEIDIESYIYLLASSFKENDKLTTLQANTQAEFFIKLCKSWPKDIFIAQTLIEKNLISKEYFSPFYQILIERSSPFDTSSFDYEYHNYAQRAKNINLLEEQLDHNKNFQSKEPSSEQYKWQTEYLQLLLTEHKDKEALDLIKEIEKSLAGRYKRPDWLRLANIELMFRNGNVEQAWQSLCHFTQIETYPETTNVTSPSVERLESALKLLDKLALNKAWLLQAYYERQLALEQYNLSNLTGLTDIVYLNGNTQLGNNLLEIMLGFAEQKTQAKAARKLADLPIIKARAITSRNIVTPSPVYEEAYGFTSIATLQAVAELATNYGLYNLAIEQRLRIKKAVDDRVNCLELARLFAANNQTTEAIKELTDVIADPKATRANHWLAITLISSIANNRPELWVLTEKVTDREFKLALQASRLANQGELLSAINLIDNQFNSLDMKFFCATLERKNNHPKKAIELLNQIPIDYKPFGINEASPLRQMIYLYSAINAPQAVLALAQKDPKLQALLQNNYSLSNANSSKKIEKLQLLRRLEQQQEYKTTLDLLALTAKAAEMVEDFELAMKYLEILKINSSPESKTKIETRINELEKKLKSQAKDNISSWQVDINLPSR